MLSGCQPGITKAAGVLSDEERVAGLSEAEPLAKGQSRGGGGRVRRSEPHPVSVLTLEARATTRSPGTHPKGPEGEPPP